jgi:hypothetical protein
LAAVGEGVKHITSPGEEPTLIADEPTEATATELTTETKDSEVVRTEENELSSIEEKEIEDAPEAAIDTSSAPAETVEPTGTTEKDLVVEPQQAIEDREIEAPSTEVVETVTKSTEEAEKTQEQAVEAAEEKQADIRFGLENSTPATDEEPVEVPTSMPTLELSDPLSDSPLKIEDPKELEVEAKEGTEEKNGVESNQTEGGKHSI